MSNRDQRLEDLSGQNQQLVGVIQELRQMLVESAKKPEPAPRDPYAELDQDDPDYDINILRVDLQRTREEMTRMKSDRQEEKRKVEDYQRQSN